MFGELILDCAKAKLWCCLFSTLTLIVCFSYLEYAGTIRSPPCIQQVVLSCAHKPFTCKHRTDILRILPAGMCT